MVVILNLKGVRILPFLQMKSIVVEMRGGVQILSLRRGLFLMTFVPANASQATGHHKCCLRRPEWPGSGMLTGEKLLPVLD